MKKFEIIATTLFGLEETLAKELQDIGATEIEILNRAVKYKGDQALLYKSNLLLRTALKVLKPINSFNAVNEQELYDGIKRIRWDQYMSPYHTLAIDGHTTGDYFRHSKYVALKSKDAVVDQFREKYSIRPDVDTVNPHLLINIHIINTTCSVSLDSSGDNLGKRGYRLHMTLAPLSEPLAAGMLLLSGWDKNSDFLDPMCGSGTIPIEAALLAHNIPVGRLRRFGFEKWRDFDPLLWEKIRNEANAQIKPFNGKIMGRDVDKSTIEISKKNAKIAGVEKMIQFETADFLTSEITMDHGTILMNPPYGDRLKEIEEITPFYKSIGSKLKNFYQGCDAWIISGNLESIKFVGLKPSKKIKLFNGQIECRLHKFELYQGSKTQDKPTDNV